MTPRVTCVGADIVADLTHPYAESGRSSGVDTANMLQGTIVVPAAGEFAPDDPRCIGGEACTLLAHSRWTGEPP